MDFVLKFFSISSSLLAVRQWKRSCVLPDLMLEEFVITALSLGNPLWGYPGPDRQCPLMPCTQLACIPVYVIYRIACVNHFPPLVVFAVIVRRSGRQQGAVQEGVLFTCHGGLGTGCAALDTDGLPLPMYNVRWFLGGLITSCLDDSTSSMYLN